MKFSGSPKGRGRGTYTPEALDLFLGGWGKSADLAHYYNLADDMITALRGRVPLTDTGFWTEYLWKSHMDRKNSQAYEVSGGEARLVAEAIAKLKEIRNFQSHVWHDNAVLGFSAELADWVEEKYRRAKAYLWGVYPQAMGAFELLEQGADRPLFREVVAGGKRVRYITVEGRVFFLSFFLSRGQMNALLSQRKGHKRTDMPLYRMKRELYSFYAHRDGAALYRLNQAEEEREAEEPADYEAVLQARQAYRMLGYLNDYPAVWKDLLPEYKEELLSACAELGLLRDFEVTDDKEGILLRHADFPEQDWLMQVGHFRELATLSLLHAQTGRAERPEVLLLQNMGSALAHRREMIRLLETPVQSLTQEDIAYLRNPEHQLLRTQGMTTQKLIAFFEGFDPGVVKRGGAALRLAQRLDEEPIQLYPQDFNEEQPRKFRRESQFMRFAAQFLVDFGPQDWYWCVERHENGIGEEAARGVHKNRIKKFVRAGEVAQEVLFRISMEADHVVIGIPRDAPLASPDGVARNYMHYHQVSIGPKAMRYLLAKVEPSGGKETGVLAAFTARLKKDFNLLAQQGGFQDGAGFGLLEAVFLPPYLKQQATGVEKLMAAARQRLDHIRGEWVALTTAPAKYTRHEKNRFVLQIYRLMDWVPEKGGAVKFLRRHEYQQLSICHYSLQQRKPKAGEHKPVRKPDQFNYLFREVFQLDSRKPPIPAAIRELLQEVQSLDELVECVGATQISVLEKELDTIQALPGQHRKKALVAFCRKMGVPIPKDCLPLGEQEERQEKQRKTLDCQVFPLHPMLVLKGLFKDVYQKSDPIGRKAVPVFKALRENSVYNRLLRADYYAPAISGLVLPKDTDLKARERVTGTLHDAQTEDVLIAMMGMRYLSESRWTQPLQAKIEQHIQTGMPYVPELYNAPVVLEVPQLKRSNEGPTGLFMEIRLHQLDDLQFRGHQHQLAAAARHYLRRYGGERPLWDPEGKEAPASGTRESPIPFSYLLEEIRLVKRTGMRLAESLFTFEKRVIDGLLAKHGSKERFHAWMLARYTPVKPGHHAHCNFDAILEHAVELGLLPQDLGVSLKYLRDRALHGNIPNESYSWATREGTALRSLLGIETDLHAARDISAYLA